VNIQELTLSLIARLSLLVMWLTFALFHLALLVVGLYALWWLQIPPQQLGERFLSFVHSLPAAIAGVLGVSALTILVLWIKLWRRIYGKITTPYLFRDIDTQVRDGK
jgi:hypothetical protein